MGKTRKSLTLPSAFLLSADFHEVRSDIQYSELHFFNKSNSLAFASNPKSFAWLTGELLCPVSPFSLFVPTHAGHFAFVQSFFVAVFASICCIWGGFGASGGLDIVAKIGRRLPQGLSRRPDLYPCLFLSPSLQGKGCTRGS